MANPLIEHVELLDREVHMPDQPHKGVKFSSTSYQSSTVEMNFARWADMHYPNKVVVTISVPGEHPHDETPAAAQSA